MSSVENILTTLAPHTETLHGIVRSAIRQGFEKGTPPGVKLYDYPAPLRERMASFVTLRMDGDLRGCVGTAYSERPLAEDVARNAFLAAFHDTRFLPLGVSEFSAINIEVSVLSPPEPLSFTDEDDLAAQLVPGRDGLVLEHEGARGLFLPQVWETLTEACDFLDQLKVKAGLPTRPLNRAVRALRFEAIKFLEELSTPPDWR
jgi:AmmeMemoRadiSam system protein A